MRNTRVVLSALGGSEVFKVIEDEVHHNWLRSYRALGKGGRFVGYGRSAAIEGGRRNVLLAVASFGWLRLAALLPGKSARWYNVMAEKKKQPDQSRLVASSQLSVVS